jgi:hypothetical protein
MSGAQPAVAKATKRAIGFMPSAAARSALVTMVAAAPSEVCEELPAVTVPLVWKAGFSFASASAEVSARGPSSTWKLRFCSVGLAEPDFDEAGGGVR